MEAALSVLPASNSLAPPALGCDALAEEAALELFRQGKITLYRLRTILGLSIYEIDAYLVDRNEWAQSLTLEDMEEDNPLPRSM